MLGQLNERIAEQKLTKLSLEQFSEDTKQGLYLLSQNLQRTSNLVQDFKSLAAQRPEQSAKSFELLPLLHQVVQIEQGQLNSQHIELSIQCQPDISIISFAKPLATVLQQLIKNSLIHGFENKEHGKINIVVSKKENNPMAISIKYYDDGTGVDKTALDKIFDPFYTTKRQLHCTGLGMLIIHNIIAHQLGGSIQCQSELGNGFEARIDLPDKI